MSTWPLGHVFGDGFAAHSCVVPAMNMHTRPGPQSASTLHVFDAALEAEAAADAGGGVVAPFA